MSLFTYQQNIMSIVFVTNDFLLFVIIITKVLDHYYITKIGGHFIKTQCGQMTVKAQVYLYFT